VSNVTDRQVVSQPEGRRGESDRSAGVNYNAVGPEFPAEQFPELHVDGRGVGRAEDDQGELRAGVFHGKGSQGDDGASLAIADRER
jgi:hypothetical protein